MYDDQMPLAELVCNFLFYPALLLGSTVQKFDFENLWVVFVLLFLSGLEADTLLLLVWNNFTYIGDQWH